MTKLGDILINPKKNINKKSYTPNQIYEDSYHYDIGGENNTNNEQFEPQMVRSHKDEYRLSELISFFIQQKELSKLEELVKDYPNAVELHSVNHEKPIFQAMTWKNLEIFSFLKSKGANFDSLDYDFSNVYENALNYPIFWPLVYGELSSEQIYQKITKTESDVYSDGCFEFLFRGDDFSLNVLKEFKKYYPEVLKKIIQEKSNNKKITNATGEVLRIILDYDNIEKDLTEYFDSKKDTTKEKYLKF